ncbi:MAG: hypothetical protein KatS3mg060_3589 [Dehalococcoidia bacterium]|nr:MAG: hypothetical protein KatS3mg060_3589 [Dehalococcoidia bacterium]
MFAPKSAEHVASERLLSLLRYTVLAPSFRNRQPWRFAVGEGEIRVFAEADDPRVSGAIPPRERDLSLGCAIENLAIAAEAAGVLDTVRLLPDPNQPQRVADVVINAAGSAPRRDIVALFEAIPERHTDEGPFLPSPVPVRVRRLLEGAVVEPDVRLVLIDTCEVRRLIESAVSSAPPSSVDAIAARLGALLRPARGKTDHRDPADLAIAAPLFGAIVASRDDRLAWLQGGRALERVWLTATSYGLHLHPLSELLLVEPFAVGIRSLVGTGLPLVPFRLGYGRLERRRTHRRPLRDVLVPWQE